MIMMSLSAKKLIDWSTEDASASVYVNRSILSDSHTGIRMNYHGNDA